MLCLLLAGCVDPGLEKNTSEPSENGDSEENGVPGH